MGLNGRLNKGNIEKRIADMEVGEEGYCVPWALAFDDKETPYLNIDMTIEKSIHGTSCMHIKRVGYGKADYQVDIKNTNYFGETYKWTKERKENLFSGVVGARKSDVVQLKYDDEDTDKKKVDDFLNSL